MIGNGFGILYLGDLDLWRSAPKIKWVHLLTKMDVWTKFEKGRSRRSGVIDQKRNGYRLTDRPTDMCKAICPLFFEGDNKVSPQRADFEFYTLPPQTKFILSGQFRGTASVQSRWLSPKPSTRQTAEGQALWLSPKPSTRQTAEGQALWLSPKPSTRQTAEGQALWSAMADYRTHCICMYRTHFSPQIIVFYITLRAFCAVWTLIWTMKAKVLGKF